MKSDYRGTTTGSSHLELLRDLNLGNNAQRVSCVSTEGIRV